MDKNQVDRSRSTQRYNRHNSITNPSKTPRYMPPLPDPTIFSCYCRPQIGLFLCRGTLMKSLFDANTPFTVDCRKTCPTFRNGDSSVTTSRFPLEVSLSRTRQSGQTSFVANSERRRIQSRQRSLTNSKGAVGKSTITHCSTLKNAIDRFSTPIRARIRLVRAPTFSICVPTIQPLDSSAKSIFNRSLSGLYSCFHLISSDLILFQMGINLAHSSTHGSFTIFASSNIVHKSFATEYHGMTFSTLPVSFVEEIVQYTRCGFLGRNVKLWLSVESTWISKGVSATKQKTPHVDRGGATLVVL